jgi:L-iditol 2-dehydrogenase
MRIAALRAPGQFEIEEVPVPDVQDNEVLVRVSACGVCASELDMWEGHGSRPFPLYLGHEVSGRVETVGAAVTGFDQGTPVGVWVTERGFAEYVTVKAAYCRPAGNVPLELALAEPLACATNAVEAADVRLGADVVIVGAGFMGHLVQQLVNLRGPAAVIVADTRRDALDRAVRLGASRVVDVREESLPGVVAELTDGRGADLIFEVTGVQEALDVLGEVTRMSGTIALVGFHQGDPRTIPLGHWNWMAFHVVNAHFRELDTIMRGMTVGMRLLAAGKVSMKELVTHRYALADIGLAFRTAREKPPGFVKATILIDE